MWWQRGGEGGFDIKQEKEMMFSDMCDGQECDVQ